jgi:hypothetical protein
MSGDPRRLCNEQSCSISGFLEDFLLFIVQISGRISFLKHYKLFFVVSVSVVKIIFRGMRW